MQTFFPSFKQYITKLNVDKHTNKLLPLLSHIQHLSTYQHVVVYIWHKLYTALNSTASVTILFHVDVSTFSRFRKQNNKNSNNNKTKQKHAQQHIV